MRKFGIPTKHRGRQYRSRLEARWAAFFDLVGWQYEYEPFDLGGWIPDFILIGARDTVLVEIKPVVEFPVDVSREIEESGAEHEVLILGCTVPIPSKENPNQFGWLAEIEYGFTTEPEPISDKPVGFLWDDAVLGRWSQGQNDRKGRIGFCHAIHSYHDRITGQHCSSHGDMDLSSAAVIDLWTKAGNLVQWKAPR